MGFQSYLNQTQTEIKQTLDRFFKLKLKSAASAGPISQAMLKKLWQFSLKGKMLRGMLAKLSYQAVGGKDFKAVIKLAAGIEILESSVLILDDIMDQDETRRGLTTIHKQFSDSLNTRYQILDTNWYGISMGINVGVLALTLAYELIEDQAVLRTIFPLVEQTAYGQALDISLQPIDGLTNQDIVRIHQHKTVAYTTLLPIKSGAVLAGCQNKNQLAALDQYAQALGLGFQIQDDILGVFGESKLTGKPAGNDLREAKRTHLIVDTISQLKGPETKKFTRLLAKKALTKKEISWLQKQIKTSGALDKSVKIAKAWIEKAKRLVGEITASKNLQTIYLDLAEFVIKRKK